MGHHLQAIIGSTRVLRQIAERFDHAHLLVLEGDGKAVTINDQDVEWSDQFAIIPAPTQLLNELIAAYSAPYSDRSNGFAYLGGGLEQLLIEYSHQAPLVYIETDYFGGPGYQGGAVYSGGTCTFIGSDMKTPSDRNLPSSWPINSALRELGITARGAFDTFGRIGLGRWRQISELVDDAKHSAQSSQ